MDELSPVERTWAETMRSPENGLEARATGGACLEAGEIIELVERGRKSSDYGARIAHVAVCPACRETLRLLCQAEEMRPRRQFVLAWPVARNLIAAGIAAALIAIWLTFPRGGGFVKSGDSVAVRPAVKKQAIDRGPKPGPGSVAVNHGPKAPFVGVGHRPYSRLAVRIRHRRPRVRIDNPPVKREVYADAGGTLEGSVVYSEVLQGEVHPVDGIVEGVVQRRPPPGP